MHLFIVIEFTYKLYFVKVISLSYISKFWLCKAVACSEPKYVLSWSILILNLCCYHIKGWGFSDHNSGVYYFQNRFPINLKNCFQSFWQHLNLEDPKWADGMRDNGPIISSFSVVWHAKHSVLPVVLFWLALGNLNSFALAKICALTCCILCSRRQSIFCFQILLCLLLYLKQALLLCFFAVKKWLAYLQQEQIDAIKDMLLDQRQKILNFLPETWLLLWYLSWRSSNTAYKQSDILFEVLDKLKKKNYDV